MQLQIFQVDAFTSSLFSGNPAAVIPLDTWLPDDMMQHIAAENNLSETAFFIKEGDDYHIRWMTPTVEVNLCGHATLATAWVIWNCLNEIAPIIRFNSRSGWLTVRKQDSWLELDFPAQTLTRLDKVPIGLAHVLGDEIVSASIVKQDIVVALTSEEVVRNLIPDFAGIRQLPYQAVIITAPGTQADFVSRFFGPSIGIDEDPVTGYAHTLLVPYWADKLSKVDMLAWQVSKRGGELRCRLEGDRVRMAGQAVLYLSGHIFLPD
jgi:PhzF family phenazine biosynthesis protein